MSYILDALKKADAERSRGQVPQLMDQPAATPGETATVGAKRAGLVAGGALVLLGLAAAGWWLRQPDAPSPAVIATPVVPPAPVVQPAAALQPVPVMPSAPVAPPVPAPMPEVATPVAATPSAPRVAAPAVTATPAITPVPAPAPALAADVRPEPVETPKAARAATRPAEEAPLPLGPAVGAPPVQVGFSRHEPDASRRRLMLDGAVLKEGDSLSPGHRLISIGVRSAVLEWQGTRYRIQY